LPKNSVSLSPLHVWGGGGGGDDASVATRYVKEGEQAAVPVAPQAVEIESEAVIAEE